MKYMALIYAAEENGPQYGTPEFDQLIGDYQTASETFNKDGVFVAGEALEDVAAATTLTIRGGKVETMDGPFAETKEQLGGYYIFDCDNLEAALKYAAMIPSAKYGRVEVRPVMVFDQ